MQVPISLASICVRDPQLSTHNPPHQIPIVAASSFVFDDLEQGIRIFDGQEEGHIYSRFGNPTIDAAASKLAALEGYGTSDGASGLFTSSGMGAISTVMLALLRPGQCVLVQEDIYGGTAALLRDVLTPLGIKVHTGDLRDLNAVEDQLRHDNAIQLIYFETPSNPLLRCVDMAALSALAHRYGTRTVADNTFATPVLQQPLRHGVDIVVHSTTKYLNGHGTGVAGAIICQDAELLRERMVPIYRLAGPSGNPWDAWLVLNGLKTLPLRMERHSYNAGAVATWLAQQPRVQAVHYPGMATHPDYALATRQMSGHGGMLSFEVAGGLTGATDLVRRLRFCTLTPTLGDVDTLVLHPATMSHRALDPAVRARLGITDGLLRLSVGIEPVADILADLEQAFEPG